jgi:hypothetical protein
LDDERAHDFSVNLVLCPDHGDLFTVSVFRSQLHFPFNTVTEKELQAKLEQKHFQECVVQYDKDELEKFPEIVSAKQVTFFGDDSEVDVDLNSVQTGDNSTQATQSGDDSLQTTASTSKSRTG